MDAEVCGLVRFSGGTQFNQRKILMPTLYEPVWLPDLGG